MYILRMLSPGEDKREARETGDTREGSAGLLFSFLVIFNSK